MTDLATLPLLDPSPMRELWEASPARAERLLGFYLEDLPSQMNSILDALQKSRPAEIGSIAHNLKSSSRQMGALKLGEAASRVEQAARAIPPDPYLHQFIQSLQSLVPQTVTAVNEQIATSSQAHLRLAGDISTSTSRPASLVQPGETEPQGGHLPK